MTNAQSTETAFEEWREEIRAFCDEVRDELSAISKRIDAERKHQKVVTFELSQETEPIEETPSNQQPAILSAARQSSLTVDATDEEVLPSAESENKETADRLQHVRRQLQAMLSANGEP